MNKILPAFFLHFSLSVTRSKALCENLNLCDDLYDDKSTKTNNNNMLTKIFHSVGSYSG